MNVEAPPQVSPLSWDLLELGNGSEKLKVCLKKGIHPKNVKSIFVFDGGSNSFKSNHFVWQPTGPRWGKDSRGNRECYARIGDGEGITGSKLRRKGIEKVFDKFTPVCLDRINDLEPDAVIIFFTEAVRAAQLNPSETENVNLFLKKFVHSIGSFPLESANVISAELEDELSFEGAKAHGFRHGFGVMTGGRSLETFELENGKRKHSETLHIGLQNLENSQNPRELVCHHFRENASYFAAPADTRVNLCAMGGGSRQLGHMLIQNLRMGGPKTRIPYGGWPLACDAKLINGLKEVAASKGDVPRLSHFTFGVDAFAELPRITHEGRPHRFIGRELIEERDARDLYNRWVNRASQIPGAAELMLFCIDSIHPEIFTINPGSTRRGAVAYVGFG